MRQLLSSMLLMVCLAATSAVLASQSGPQPPATSTGVITGRVTDERGAPVVGATVQAIRRLKRWNGPYYEVGKASHDETDDRGLFRLHSLATGNYFVSVQARRAGPHETTGYLRTYFPGTTSLADAQPVAVRPAEEQSIAVRITPTRFTSVSGIATTASGLPAANYDVSLRARPIAPGAVGVEGQFISLLAASTRVGADGTFSLSPITAGNYTLTVTNGYTREGRPFEIAELPIEVTPTPVTRIKVVTAPGATVSGRLEWAGNGPAPWPRDTRSLGRLRAALIGGDTDFGGLDTDVRPDGTFQFTNLYGLRRMESLGLPRRWAISGIGGPREILAGPNLDIRPGTVVSDLSVIVTDRVGSLVATVVDEEGKPVETGSVLLMPMSPTEPGWRSWGYRATQRTRGEAGVWLFEIEPILPGSYLAAAIDVEAYRLTADSDLMERARAGAVRVDVREWDTRVALRIVRLRPYVQNFEQGLGPYR